MTKRLALPLEVIEVEHLYNGKINLYLNPDLPNVHQIPSMYLCRFSHKLYKKSGRLLNLKRQKFSRSDAMEFLRRLELNDD